MSGLFYTCLCVCVLICRVEILLTGWASAELYLEGMSIMAPEDRDVSDDEPPNSFGFVQYDGSHACWGIMWPSARLCETFGDERKGFVVTIASGSTRRGRSLVVTVRVLFEADVRHVAVCITDEV